MFEVGFCFLVGSLLGVGVGVIVGVLLDGTVGSLVGFFLVWVCVLDETGGAVA